MFQKERGWRPHADAAKISQNGLRLADVSTPGTGSGRNGSRRRRGGDVDSVGDGSRRRRRSESDRMSEGGSGGPGSRLRRGRDAEIPWETALDPPWLRRGYSTEMGRGDAAAPSSRIVRGGRTREAPLKRMGPTLDSAAAPSPILRGGRTCEKAPLGPRLRRGHDVDTSVEMGRPGPSETPPPPDRARRRGRRRRRLASVSGRLSPARPARSTASCRSWRAGRRPRSRPRATV